MDDFEQSTADELIANKIDDVKYLGWVELKE